MTTPWHQAVSLRPNWRALDRGMAHGIWGGMTEEERHALRVVIPGQRRPA